MDINTVATIINITTPLATAAAAAVAAAEYLHTKNAGEQARYIAVYPVLLYNAVNNSWVALKIAPAGIADIEENRTKSMAVAVVIENNSQQPIRDFSAKINIGAIEREVTQNGNRDETRAETEKKYDVAPEVNMLKIIPPGKWVVSIDETSDRSQKSNCNQWQGFNSLEDVLEFNEGTTRYNPIIRTDEDPLEEYSFIDSTSQVWCYRDGKLNKISR
ncbi:hypothetical protein Corgl_0068 [Coriobacterium glomerans PW2]|uniref:Uncharacterized protein n=1 Tax=Coriobacterium glomerans (strain ATCC 49209 / DSM 20642 / JCM 10262 / PW2) TaxID=700015 RepID=F2N6Z7_CORGP|nr:hypothetical protein [Coriobacterium glomerans]AEB06196.1 hypothetical protein Corgl_0068 [Coriobacterium glomerans PW2]